MDGNAQRLTPAFYLNHTEDVVINARLKVTGWNVYEKTDATDKGVKTVCQERSKLKSIESAYPVEKKVSW